MPEVVNGVLQALPKGGGYLRAVESSFQPSPDDVWVPVKLMRSFGSDRGGGGLRPEPFR